MQKNRLLFMLLQRVVKTKMFKYLLPLFALVYWVWPIDLLPFIPIDDIAVATVAAYLFLQDFSNPGNRQTQQQGANGSNYANSAQSSRADDDNVVDTTWHVVK